ncbi:MAG: hypothetical protein PHN82_09435 [bacterium]|nr:hypothetical protein [bacterium]
MEIRGARFIVSRRIRREAKYGIRTTDRTRRGSGMIDELAERHVKLMEGLRKLGDYL